MPNLLEYTPRGWYCPIGDFYVDPDVPVERAVVTHGHTDHAYPGSRHYLAAASSVPILRERLGPEADIEALPYGQSVTINGVNVSLHPAGHVLGSAQVRIEYRGEVWVVSGDYKTVAEPSCEPFEPIRCHVFVTESTFALPVYRWRPQSEIMAEIHAWWRANQEQGRTSVLFAYALGKTQRLLAALDPEIGPICVHGAARVFLPAYEAAGVRFPPIHSAEAAEVRRFAGRALVLAPYSSFRTPWFHALGPTSTASASGWMQVRGHRRRQGVDRGFVLSDHADWEGLLSAIEATGAERIGVTHGHTEVFCRWLREQGMECWQASLVRRWSEDVG